MGIARVNINDVKRFRKSVEDEGMGITGVKSSIAAIDTVNRGVNSEITRINDCKAYCNTTLGNAQWRLRRFNQELERLKTRLSATSRTIRVREYKGLDSEGNAVYEIVEKENSAYIELENEIEALKGKISNLSNSIDNLKDKIEVLEATEKRFSQALASFQKDKERLGELCDTMGKKTSSAIKSLGKAVFALEEYLHTTVLIEPVPSHTSVAWGEIGQPETIIKEESCERLIPGTPGVVNYKVDKLGRARGNSIELAKNLFKEFDIPIKAYSEQDQRKIKKGRLPGHEAQHIIPIQMANHNVIVKIGMDMNNAKNGIPLPVPSEKGHALSTHKGYHSIYNEIVKEQLDKIEQRLGQNATVEETVIEVAKLQGKLRKAVESGLPLYAKKQEKKGEEKHKVWNRGGGATIEMWRSFLNEDD